jgi:hypothetical protein
MFDTGPTKSLDCLLEVAQQRLLPGKQKPELDSIFFRTL